MWQNFSTTWKTWVGHRWRQSPIIYLYITLQQSSMAGNPANQTTFGRWSAIVHEFNQWNAINLLIASLIFNNGLSSSWRNQVGSQLPGALGFSRRPLGRWTRNDEFEAPNLGLLLPCSNLKSDRNGLFILNRKNETECSQSTHLIRKRKSN